MDLNWILQNVLNTVNPFAGLAYNLAPGHTGSWGTKDFGLSEIPSDALGIPRTSQGGSNLNGAVLGSSTSNTNNNLKTPPPGTNTNDLTTSGGGSGGSGGSGGVGTDNSGVDLARQAYEQRVNAIRNLFAQTKQRAADIRSEGDRTFADLIKAVGAFRDRSKNLFDSAGQEITNNSSQILGSNARTAREQEGNLRAKGRALGLGDSSKFRQQTGLAGRLATQQGNTIATRGEQNRSNQNLFQERQDQAQSQEDTANTYRQNIYDEARRIENAGVDQFGGNLDAASNTFGTSLNNILNYQRQLAAINPLKADSISAYQPDFSNVKDAISQIIGTPLSQGSGSNIPGGDIAINATTPTNIMELLKRNRGLYA